MLVFRERSLLFKDRQWRLCRFSDNPVFRTTNLGKNGLFFSFYKSSVDPVVCSSLHTDLLYLSLSCPLYCVMFKSMELCLCCPWLKSLQQLSCLSAAPPLPLSPLCVLLFLSSVHIGGPQNAVCSLAGYLFINVIYCR